MKNNRPRWEREPGKPRYYFAYGSNLSRAQMRQRCPDAEPFGSYVLTGFQLVFRGVADIVPSYDHSVPGAIYVITERDERALDRFEGWRSDQMGAYRKEVFACPSDEGEARVMYYAMNSTRLGSPTTYYWNIIRTGYRDWGLETPALLAARKAADLYEKKERDRRCLRIRAEFEAEEQERRNPRRPVSPLLAGR